VRTDVAVLAMTKSAPKMPVRSARRAAAMDALDELWPRERALPPPPISGISAERPSTAAGQQPAARRLQRRAARAPTRAQHAV
jgi:hypothetical protein